MYINFRPCADICSVSQRPFTDVTHGSTFSHHRDNSYCPLLDFLESITTIHCNVRLSHTSSISTRAARSSSIIVLLSFPVGGGVNDPPAFISFGDPSPLPGGEPAAGVEASPGENPWRCAQNRGGSPCCGAVSIPTDIPSRAHSACRRIRQYDHAHLSGW